jgi:hypothetical protein
VAHTPAPRGPRNSNGWVELAHSAGRIARSRWGARLIAGSAAAWLTHVYWTLIWTAIGQVVSLVVLFGILGIAIRGWDFKGKSH